MYTVLTRTYVLGSYVYLPGLMSLDHAYTYQDLRPWTICIHTGTYVLGSYDVRGETKGVKNEVKRKDGHKEMNDIERLDSKRKEGVETKGRK